MRYRTSQFERMALDDIHAGNPYLWDRPLTGEHRRLYARGWLWFKPQTRDQAEIQSLYADDARADLGIVPFSWDCSKVGYIIGTSLRYLVICTVTFFSLRWAWKVLGF